VKPEDAQKVDLAATQGIVHFVLRNGSDKQEFKGPPALYSQLSGTLPPKPAVTEAKPVHKAEVAVKKGYEVETFLGATVKTESFQ
jgi:pilus assembly protein CpaB